MHVAYVCEPEQVVFLDHRSKVKEFRKRSLSLCVSLSVCVCVCVSSLTLLCDRLARFLEERYQPDEERYSEVAWQYAQAGDDAKLIGCITNPAAFAMFRSDKHQEDFMLHCRSAGKNASGGSEYALVLDKLAENLGLNAMVEEVQGGVDEVDARIDHLAATTYLVSSLSRSLSLSLSLSLCVCVCV